MMTAQEIWAFLLSTGVTASAADRIVARWLADQKDAGEASLRRFLDAYDKLRQDGTVTEQ